MRTHQYIVSSLALMALSPLAADASALRVQTDRSTYTQGDTIRATVVVESTGEAVNAVQGALTYPDAMLRPVSIARIDTIVDFWIDEPTYTTPGQVTFEGIIVNPGYQGARGEVAQVTFRALTTGTVTIDFSSASLLANDGQGTNVLTEAIPQTITIVDAPPRTTQPGMPIGDAQEADTIDPAEGSCTALCEPRTITLWFADPTRTASTSYVLYESATTPMLQGDDAITLADGATFWLAATSDEGTTVVSDSKRVHVEAAPEPGPVPQSSTRWLWIIVLLLLVLILVEEWRLRKRS
jgi:hypothetical protein